MRKVALTVASKNGAFVETYIEGEGSRGLKEGEDANAFGERIIAYWNDTLQPHEHRRKLIQVNETFTDEHVFRQHDWHKTNLVTVERRGEYYDIMKCERCGVTGKRRGLSYVARDAKFKAKKYEFCT